MNKTIISLSEAKRLAELLSPLTARPRAVFVVVELLLL